MTYTKLFLFKGLSNNTHAFQNVKLIRYSVYNISIIYKIRCTVFTVFIRTDMTKENA